MATIKAFYRSSTKKVENVNIRFRLSDGKDTQLFHKSEITINKNDFDEKKQCYKERKLNTSSPEIRQLFNKSITDRKDLIIQLYNAEPIKENLTSEWLEKSIDRTLHPEKYVIENKELKVLEHIKLFVDEATSRKIKGTNSYVSPNTVKQYVAAQKTIINFAQFKNRDDWNFSEINEAFYNDFLSYLTDVTYKVKTRRGVDVNEVRQLTKNTIGKNIRVFKTMIATSKNREYDLSSFIALKEEVDNIYLNEDELKQLEDLDLSENKKLEEVRDWFLLMAWTASRYSDTDKVTKSNINIEDSIIKYEQEKTSNPVIIPLHPTVIKILQKYDYNMPKVLDNDEFNYFAKDICEMAGFNDTVTFTRTIGGKRVSETRPKHNWASSHSCRRSFCTNMYKRGVDTLTIRSISGHKTEVSFLKYIKVSPMEHAQKLAAKFKEFYN